MFNIKLSYNSQILNHDCDFDFENEADDITSLIYHICESIGLEKQINLKINGFYDSEWKTLINVDLYILLEQIKGIFEFIYNKNIKVVNLNFPEQHLQRYLYLEKNQDKVNISCESGLTGKLNMKEIISLRDLERIFIELLNSFANITKQLCFDSYNHYLFKNWLSYLLEIKLSFK